DMAAAQEALANETVEVSVGGGAVKVVINGHQRVQAITLNKDVIDLEDEEWMNDLQDLLVVAVNQAVEQSPTLAGERRDSIGGGSSGMPGLGGFFGSLFGARRRGELLMMPFSALPAVSVVRTKR